MIGVDLNPSRAHQPTGILLFPRAAWPPMPPRPWTRPHPPTILAAVSVSRVSWKLPTQPSDRGAWLRLIHRFLVANPTPSQHRIILAMTVTRITWEPQHRALMPLIRLNPFRHGRRPHLHSRRFNFFFLACLLSSFLAWFVRFARLCIGYTTDGLRFVALYSPLSLHDATICLFPIPFFPSSSSCPTAYILGYLIPAT